jgi:hypothetical protein
VSGVFGVMVTFRFDHHVFTTSLYPLPLVGREGCHGTGFITGYCKG